MERRKKALVCFLLFSSLIIKNISVVKAEALPEIMESGSTIADYVMSYYAIAGSAVANTEWINTLYGSLGSTFGTLSDFVSNGYLIQNDQGMWEPVGEFVSAIENTSAYQSLHLGDMFGVSAAEAAAGGGFAAASGGSILAGAAGGVASTGALTLFGGVTAAYWGGIGLGTLIAHATGLYGDTIKAAVPMTQKEFLESVPAGSNIYTQWYQGQYYFRGYSTADIFIYIYNNQTPYLILHKDGVSSVRLNYTDRFGNNNYQNVTLSSGYAYTTNLNDNVNSIMYPLPLIRKSMSPQNYVSLLRSGQESLPRKISPDLIGENGNLYGVDENGKITVPDMKPQIDPGVQAGKPLSQTDWLNFANSVQNNNSTTDPVNNNKTVVKNIVERITINKPSNVPTPNPNPNPDLDPDPDPDPGPWTPPVVTPVPKPDYDVENETQPDWENESSAETEPVPPSIPTGKPWIIEGLQDKFPFCIPWDIKNMFSKLNTSSRQAPYISWRFNPPHTPVDYTFELDLSDFEEVAALLRTLELIGFIVGLAFATRYLIGAT